MPAKTPETLTSFASSVVGWSYVMEVPAERTVVFAHARSGGATPPQSTSEPDFLALREHTVYLKHCNKPTGYCYAHILLPHGIPPALT